GSNDDADPSLTSTNESKVGFHAISGTTYYIQVGGFQFSSQGSLALEWGPAPTNVPANDSFEDPTQLSGDSNTLDGTDDLATMQLNEPDQTGGDLLDSVWYAYTPTRDGTATFTMASVTNSSLAVYTGTDFSSPLVLVSSGSPYDNAPGDNVVTFD